MKYAVKLFYSEEEALKEVKTAEELWIKTAKSVGELFPSL